MLLVQGKLIFVSHGFYFHFQYVSMTFVSVIVQGAGVGIAVEQIDTVSYFLNIFQ